MDDNLWVVANQADEIVVVDPTGKAIARLGDFGGAVKRGSPVRLLFPASLRFSDSALLVTNLSRDLRLLSPTFYSVDSAWCAQVARLGLRVDRDVRGEASRERHVGGLYPGEADRNPLHHLDEVSGGVVGGNEREPGAGSAR